MIYWFFFSSDLTHILNWCLVRKSTVIWFHDNIYFFPRKICDDSAGKFPNILSSNKTKDNITACRAHGLLDRRWYISCIHARNLKREENWFKSILWYYSYSRCMSEEHTCLVTLWQYTMLPTVFVLLKWVITQSGRMESDFQRKKLNQARPRKRFVFTFPGIFPTMNRFMKSLPAVGLSLLDDSHISLSRYDAFR